eukprot:9931520-Heterocapsa_arctica.AAC.1
MEMVLDAGETRDIVCDGKLLTYDKSVLWIEPLKLDGLDGLMVAEGPLDAREAPTILRVANSSAVPIT